MVHFKQNVVPLQPQNQTVTNYGTIRSFEKRRTIRDFTGEIVSDELLAKVLNTALYAPPNDHLRQLEGIKQDYQDDARFPVFGKKRY